jgi:hypothetical protein
MTVVFPFAVAVVFQSLSRFSCPLMLSAGFFPLFGLVVVFLVLLFLSFSSLGNWFAIPYIVF